MHKAPDVMICLETATSWGRGIVRGIIRYARDNSPWHLLLDPHGPEDSYSLAKARTCSGVIGKIADRNMAETITRAGLPLVTVSSIRHEGIDIPSVITSPEASARTAVEHFRARGFTSFGCVGDYEQPYVQDLFDAFRRHLGPLGRACKFCQSEQPNARLANWLAGLPKPVAVLCWGPGLGRHVIDICSAEGIRIPHEVAVLGSDFDDLLSDASHPAQSGLKIPAEQIGMTAATMLDTLMKGREPKPRHVQIEPRGVIERLSTETLAVADERMARVMRYIKDNYREPIMVTDILRENPMARRSLERKFRDLYGCSIVEQIRNLRISEARRLLAETDMPITVLAEECGFSSYNYLNRVFREETGLSPSEYRKSVRKFGSGGT